MGERRTIAGKLEAYGDEWQIIHPEVLSGRARAQSLRSASRSIALTEGLTNRRMGELAASALERAPELPEWIEPGLNCREGWRRLARARSRRRTAIPATADARRRLAYDEVFANQLALLLLRQSARRHRERAAGRRWAADRQAAAALPADRRAAPGDRGDPRRHGAGACRCCACSRAMSARARHWWR